MSKRNRGDNIRREGPGPEPSSNGSGNTLQIAVLVGVGALLVLSFLGWSETRKLSTGLDARLGQVQATVAQLQAKIDQGLQRAQQPQRPQGPDPDKVYTVKTGGSPAEGPGTAAVTIAEFSDFQ